MAVLFAWCDCCSVFDGDEAVACSNFSISTGLLQLTVSRPTRTSVEPLQQVQNAAARLVLNLGLRDHVTPALKQLHWLPVEHRIKYNLCTLMHQIHTMRAPQYLAHSVQLIAESSRRPGLGSKIPLTTSN